MRPRVLLLSMPWAALGEPSLGLGILKACLEQARIRCRVRHCNLFLLRYLHASTYIALANAYALNDFVFSYELDPEVSGVQYRLARVRVEELIASGILRLNTNDPDTALHKLIDARRTIFSTWLDECVDFVVSEQPTLVGLTCLFDQTISSVALARRIRKRLPSVTIALGGYALEGPIARQLLRCFPWLDAVCLGDGELAIVELARASVSERSLDDIPNTVTPNQEMPTVAMPRRRRGHFLALREPNTNRLPPVAMADVPIPNFDDYFSDIEELKYVDHVEIEYDTLPVESSRGCWWGQRHHCVFCGIDDETMRYRVRSPDNTIHMLDTLSQRYGMRSFRFSDYILPYTYFSSLLPKLAARKERYHLECEIKSNLTEEKFVLLRAAGFGECQPGIESFSTLVLNKMNKGVTGIRNIQTLVLGKIHGVRIHWNFLYGFPSDELNEYEAMLKVVPLLYHLDPPHGCQEVEITRFAPLQVDPERFGITETSSALPYGIIFSPRFLEKTAFDLDAYAYYFERLFFSSASINNAYQQLVIQFNHWKAIQAKRPVELTWSADGEIIAFRDSRYGEEPVISNFGPNHNAVFQACAGSARSIKVISNLSGTSIVAAERLLKELISARLVLRENNKYIGLATPHEKSNNETGFQRKWVVA